jgi:MtN3 and saliva related transmembrane protein
MLSFGYLIIDSPAACGHTSCPSSQILSKVQLVTFMSGVSLWLFYGVLIASVPVILANGMTLGLTAVILLLKVYFR